MLGGVRGALSDERPYLDIKLVVLNSIDLALKLNSETVLCYVF